MICLQDNSYQIANWKSRYVWKIMGGQTRYTIFWDEPIFSIGNSIWFSIFGFLCQTIVIYIPCDFFQEEDLYVIDLIFFLPVDMLYSSIKMNLNKEVVLWYILNFSLNNVFGPFCDIDVDHKRTQILWTKRVFCKNFIGTRLVRFCNFFHKTSLHADMVLESQRNVHVCPELICVTH